MLQARWMLFQAAVATPVFYFCSVELNGQGLAPAIVAMVAALLATVFVRFVLDLFRGFRVGQKAKRNAGIPPPIPRSAGDGSQHIRRIGISEDRRELPKITP
jgi:hypothetical protein